MIGIGLVTLLLLVGGIMSLNRNQTKTVETPQFDPAILIRENSHALVGENSRLTLVEFADYQCSFCARSHLIILDILSEYGGQLTYAYRHFPLPQHQHAQLASLAAEAAGDQGKFWEMNDLLFANQDEWTETSDALPIFQGYAEQLELDVAQFTQSVESQQFIGEIQQDLIDASTAGVSSTPSFFVNGERFAGSAEALKAYIETLLAEPAQPTESTEPAEMSVEASPAAE